ncbi:MAG: proline--tRNA ligase, partial [Rhodothermales bacterium]|nr:proline--tRNA ligase [Rhodothermales bacterium]
PTQVVIVPIYRKDEDRVRVLETAGEIRNELDAAGVSVKLDDRESQRPGWKFHEHEVQGVPVRIAIGPRDLENGTVEVARRDERTKEIVSTEGLAQHVEQLLNDIQQNLYSRAMTFREEHTSSADTYDEFKSILEDKGGFVLAHWDGTAETEAVIKNETKATIRCIPLDQPAEQGVDMVTGKPSSGRVVFARAY